MPSNSRHCTVARPGEQPGCQPSSDSALNAQWQQISQLLDHPDIRGDRQRRRLQRRLTAERHNVFDALGLAHKEIYHSRFIGYLLDPHARHDQGERFLRPFLARLGLKHGVPDDLSATRIAVELDTAGDGRIDLVIALGDGTTIAIENKVRHGEQDRQLERYWRWLRRLGRPQDRLMLVFLTPQGRHGTSAAPGDRVVRMGYADLACILTEGLRRGPHTAGPLIDTTRQYIALCRRMGQGPQQHMPTLNPLITELLKDPARLAVALDLQDHLGALQEQIKQQFREHLLAALQARLEKRPELAAHWTVGTSSEAPGHLGLLGLLPRHPVERWGYRCVAEIYFVKPGFVGWRRPACVDLNRPEPRPSAALESKLRSPDRHTHAWWVSLQKIPDAGLTSHLGGWNSDNILAIHADNMSPCHDMAACVADMIWATFEPYHQDVEVLQPLLPDGLAV